MAVFRVEKNSNYTTIANYHFKDRSLSWKAKGLLSTMLSLPEDWDYSLAGLVTLSNDGMTATRSAVKELEEHGYLKREPIRQKGKIIDWEYSVYEYPQVEKPLVENPQVDNPIVENPIMENHTQLNTKELNTNKSNTKVLNNNKSNNMLEAIEAGFNLTEEEKERLSGALNDFAEMRKKIKKPLTDKALKIIVNKLSKLSNSNVDIAIEILENSIANSWQGVFPLKQEDIKARQEAPANNVIDYPF